jgi:hypothetical protein
MVKRWYDIWFVGIDPIMGIFVMAERERDIYNYIYYINFLDSMD